MVLVGALLCGMARHAPVDAEHLADNDFSGPPLDPRQTSEKCA
jgi:hypothetical protein